MDDVSFDFLAVARWLGAYGQFHLFEPASQIDEQCLKVRDDDFELRRDAIDFFPFVDELNELILQFAAVTDGRKNIDIQPMIA